MSTFCHDAVTLQSMARFLKPAKSLMSVSRTSHILKGLIVPIVIFSNWGLGNMHIMEKDCSVLDKKYWKVIFVTCSYRVKGVRCSTWEGDFSHPNSLSTKCLFPIDSVRRHALEHSSSEKRFKALLRFMEKYFVPRFFMGDKTLILRFPGYRMIAATREVNRPTNCRFPLFHNALGI